MMVSVPRPAGPAPVITSVVRGVARCFADGSGHNYPVPSTRVELLDRSPVPVSGNALLATEMTDADGKFVLVVQGLDLRRIPWALRLVNLATRDSHSKESRMILTAPTVEQASPGHYHVTYDIADIVLPWDPLLGVLAKVGGRAFVYHDDFARTLASGLRHGGSAISLLRLVSTDQPDRDLELDQMFSALEAQSTSGTTALAERMAKETQRILNVNPFKFVTAAEFFPLALQQIALMSVRQVRARAMGMQLGGAMRKAFDGSLAPSFFEQIPGVVAGCALLYAAGHVAKGRKVTIHFAGPEQVPIPRLRQYYQYCHVTDVVTA
jgi:hypothetical protein